jgi:hypothetical protein
VGPDHPPRFGFIARFGYAYAAHRAGARSWYLGGAGWRLLAYVGLAINPPAAEDSQLDGFSSLLMVIAWAGAFVQALALRGEYVRRVSRRRRDSVLVARRRMEERRRARELVRSDPALARELGVGRPDVPGATPMGVVDVNHAEADALAKLPDVDPELAERIVAVREEVDGFSSAEDLGIVMDLEPGVIDSLREHAVIVPR